MKINVDFEKMKEIYGEEIIEIIHENMDLIERNINTMKDLKFTDIEGIFERCPMIFMEFSNKFRNKIETLIANLGEDYVNIIESDISIIEKICS